MRQDITMDAYAACVKLTDASLYCNESYQEYHRELLEEYAAKKAEAEQSGDEGAANAMDAQIMATGAALKSAADRHAFLERRILHALKRLDDKGLLADDNEALEHMCEQRGMLEARTVLQAIDCVMGGDIISIKGDEDLDKETWKRGIDLAMVFHERDIAMSDQLYGPVLERNLAHIYTQVLMVAYGSKLNRVVRSDEYDERIMQPLIERYLGDPKAVELIMGIVNGKIKDAVDAANADIRSAMMAKDKAEKALEAARLEIARLEKAVRPKAREEEKAKARLEAEKAKREAAENDVQILKAELEKRDRAISALSARIPVPDDLPELPAGAMFFGGHVNLTKKIREAHPDWTFIDGTDENFTAPAKAPPVLFIWDGHMSHPAWWRVKNAMYGRCPVAYLKSTNTDKLEAEMRLAWAAASQACTGDGKEKE